MMKSQSSLLVIVLAFLAGCPLTPEHPFDERRCEPSCVAPQKCINGKCLTPDGGVSSLDLANDAVSIDAPSKDGPVEDATLSDTSLDGQPMSDISVDGIPAVDQTLVLKVTPNEAFNATADEGSSPFPADKVYTMTNLSNQNISYGVSAQSGSFYQILPATTGSISAGGSKDITIELVASYPFVAGTFNDTFRFTAGTEFYDREIAVTVLHAGKNGWNKHASNPILDPAQTQSWALIDMHNPIAIGSQKTIWFLGKDGAWGNNIGRAVETTTDTWIADSMPVFQGVKTSTWEAVLGPFSIHHDGSLYHLWYSAKSLFVDPTTKKNPPRVGYATSPDGISWTRYAATPVFDATNALSWGADGISQLAVIRDGTTYKMWFVVPQTASESAIGLATSTDGKAWSTQGTKLLTVGLISGISVMREGAAYRMWYAVENQIFYASSTDGEQWTTESVPALSAGASGTFDSTSFGGLSVVRESSKQLRMYYSGNGNAIGMATSSP